MRELKGVEVILCTISMLSNDLMKKRFTRIVPLTTLIVDEASQIEIGAYLPVFTNYPSIRKACFIGDDKQCESHTPLYSGYLADYFIVPPYGQDELEELQSIFEVPHLHNNVVFLDTQCMCNILFF